MADGKIDFIKSAKGLLTSLSLKTVLSCSTTKRTKWMLEYLSSLIRRYESHFAPCLSNGFTNVLFSFDLEKDRIRYFLLYTKQNVSLKTTGRCDSNYLVSYILGASGFLSKMEFLLSWLVVHAPAQNNPKTFLSTIHINSNFIDEADVL